MQKTFVPNLNILRYFLDIAYQGTAYHGWQIQANAHSVQAELNRALSTILRQPIETIGSGRTDTGVHAEQQFVHFDLPSPIEDTSQLVHKLNALLPFDIAVKSLFAVPAETHARFDAVSRRYEYRISQVKNPFLQNLALFYTKPLRLDLMDEASQLLLQYEDFESFSRVKTEVNHFRCQITEAFWENKGNVLIFHIKADRFLRGMVRAIVGTLLQVGRNQLTRTDFESVILSKDRKKAGMAVPPEGLFLTEVAYPFACEPRLESVSVNKP